VDGVLFKRNLDSILLRCNEEDQMDRFLNEFHVGPVGGHFSARGTTMNIMRESYF